MSQASVSAPDFVVSPMTIDDLDEATAMRLQSWRDTYRNDEIGVTKEWIEAHIADQLSPDMVARRRQRFENSDVLGWIARDSKGELIAATTPYIEENGRQRVGSLYVAKDWKGKGVASDLIGHVIDWADPQKPLYLELVSYNDRARAFYEKWGFKIVAGTEHLFKDVLPGIEMMRPGDKERS